MIRTTSVLIATVGICIVIVGFAALVGLMMHHVHDLHTPVFVILAGISLFTIAMVRQ